MFIVPNGTDISFFSPRESEPEPHTMVFPGVMNYHPNDQGIHYFLDEIFPRITARVPDAKIYVVGSRPSGRLLGRASDKIIVTGHVKDIRPYIAGAQVFVIPLWVGGGTRLKVLEAMAMKKPIVSTTIGCEGINVKHNESVLFADAPAEFADAVVRLFNDPVLRTRISTAAHTIVTQNGHTWRDIGQRLEEVYNATCPHGSIGTMEGVVHPAYYSNVL
jgi:glycosyltransferase involved in cell wall biosynthesis